MASSTHSVDFEKDSAQYATITDAAQTGLDFNGAQDFTIEFWFKPETVGSGGDSTWVGKGQINATDRSYRVYQNNGDSHLYLYISDDGTSGGDTNVKITASTLTAGKWYHVAAAYDASAGQCFGYINGTQVSSNTGLNTSLYDTPSNFTIGGHHTTGDADGIIKDVRVWSDIRTAAEIRGNMSKELNGDEAGLVGYWKLNNNYTDSTSNGNDLTATNSPTFVPIVPTPYTSKQSIDLEASSSQYGSVADQAELSLSGDMTLEAWIKLEAVDGTNPGNIITKYDAAANKRSYKMWIHTDGTLQFIASNDGAATTAAASDYDFFDGSLDDTWYHVAVTYDASAGTCKFYINGVLDSTGSGLDTGTVHDNDSKFMIGAEEDVGGSGAKFFFDGLIREARVWNDIRTDEEILDNFHKELDGTEAGLVGYWKLDGDWTDSTSNANTLTASGSPVFRNEAPWDTSGTILEITGSTDVTDVAINDSTPDSNDGSATDFNVGENSGGPAVVRTLIKFDLSSIPSTATINACYLLLTYNTDQSTNDRAFEIYRLKRAWVEGEATWNNYDTSNTWSTAGASHANDREQFTINTYSAQIAAPDTTTPGRTSKILNTAAIEDWTNGTTTNNGMILQVATETDDDIRYSSSENATAAERPVLVVDYTEAAADSTAAPIIFM